MNDGLFEALKRHASERSDATALRDVDASGGARALDWRALHRSVRRFASRLRRDAPGVTLVSAPNCAELQVSLLAGLWAGERVLPISPDLQSPGLREIAQRAGASRVIGDDDALRALAGSGVEGIALARAFAPAPEPDDAPLPAKEGSILLPSSGTTGPPKLVRRHLAALEAVGRGCRDAIGIRSDDAMLLAVPLHHSYGIDHGLLAAVMAGCALELQRGFDVGALCAALAADRITILPASPFIFDALARAARGGGGAPSLRRAYSAGSPLPRRVFDAFERSHGIRIGQIYGATEFGSVTYGDPDDDDFSPESTGAPFPGVELRVLDPDEPVQGRSLPPGREGLIAISTPSMFTEYVDAPDDGLADGFFSTGDLGRLDARGRLTLTGRIKLIVDVGGLKVNPLEVESVLVRHPAVREAVVVAVPFTDTAERLKGILVLEEGCEVDPLALRRFAREHLLPYKLPRSFEIRHELPRSPTGKLLRSEIDPGAGPKRRGR